MIAMVKITMRLYNVYGVSNLYCVTVGMFAEKNYNRDNIDSIMVVRLTVMFDNM